MMENINTSNSLEHILEEIEEHLNKIDNIKPENNKTENPRLQKGITLHQQGHVKQNKDPNTWTVKGQNTKTYNVKYIPNIGWICNCPDHTYRNETCKHIHATKIQTSQNINLKKEEEENTKPSPSPSLIGVKISKNNSKNQSFFCRSRQSFAIKINLFISLLKDDFVNPKSSNAHLLTKSNTSFVNVTRFCSFLSISHFPENNSFFEPILMYSKSVIHKTFNLVLYKFCYLVLNIYIYYLQIYMSKCQYDYNISDLKKGIKELKETNPVLGDVISIVYSENIPITLKNIADELKEMGESQEIDVQVKIDAYKDIDKIIKAQQ